MKTAIEIVLLALVLTVLPSLSGACVGDVNGDGRVTVEELIRCIPRPCFTCLPGENDVCLRAFDASGDGTITIDEFVRAVNNALVGCPTT
jgi:hypothetical protein